MTKAQWLTCIDPSELLNAVNKKAWVRKRRLFACACVRRIWSLLTDVRSQKAVEIAEEFADGKISREVVKRYRRTAGAAARLTPRPAGQFLHSTWSGADAAEILLNMSTEYTSAAARAATAATLAGIPTTLEKRAQADLVRDLFPFDQTTQNTSWATPITAQLAQAAYDERQLPSGELEPHRLGVLADALEEVGAPAELVAHLRIPGPHVRGCHVVDFCLGLS